jgi:hypothetical protein
MPIDKILEMWYNNSGERMPQQNKFYEVFNYDEL